MIRLTPLHLVSFYGWVEMVRELLDLGASACSEDSLGRTPLHLVGDGDNLTPLHVVSYYGRVDMVRTLLDHGATANLWGNMGQTPLHLVAGRRSRYPGLPGHNFVPIAKLLLGRAEMVEVLLNYGATANLEVTSRGRTLLHLVAWGQCGFGYIGVRIARLLLKHGADVNAQDMENTTPLHLASYFGSVEISRVLLNHGASPNARRKLGRVPLHLVAEGKHVNGVPITELLLDHGADVNAQDEGNTTPLHLASYRGSAEIVRVLLGRGAIATLEDNLGRSAMHLLVEGLLNSDKCKTTPLHLASYFGKIEIARVLLDRGANASAKNVRGLTSLHMVSRGVTYYSHGDGVEVTQLLLEHGADINAQDENHATALDLALYHERTEVASLLFHYGDKANAKNEQVQTTPQLEGGQLDDEHCPPRDI